MPQTLKPVPIERGAQEPIYKPIIRGRQASAYINHPLADGRKEKVFYRVVSHPDFTDFSPSAWVNSKSIHFMVCMHVIRDHLRVWHAEKVDPWDENEPVIIGLTLDHVRLTVYAVEGGRMSEKTLRLAITKMVRTSFVPRNEITDADGRVVAQYPFIYELEYKPLAVDEDVEDVEMA